MAAIYDFMSYDWWFQENSTSHKWSFVSTYNITAHRQLLRKDRNIKSTTKTKSKKTKPPLSSKHAGKTPSWMDVSTGKSPVNWNFHRQNIYKCIHDFIGKSPTNEGFHRQTTCKCRFSSANHLKMAVFMGESSINGCFHGQINYTSRFSKANHL